MGNLSTNDMYTDKEIGLLIKSKRIEKGLTQGELGDMLGVGNTAVYKWEKGIVRNIKRSTIQSLADILGISPLNIVGFKVEDTERSARKARQQRQWLQHFGKVDFTDTEFTEIINYAQFVLSKRPTEKDK